MILSVYIVLVSFANSSSLRCYDCACPLGYNIFCETNPQKENSRTCSGSAVCAKFIINNPGQRVLTRGCGPPTICGDLENQYANNPAVTVGECKTCNFDDCNGAFSVVSGGVLIAVGVVLLGVFQ